MTKKWTNNPWQPAPDFINLFDGRSGNDVNGLGEPEVRKPDQIFWFRRPGEGPFAELQHAVVERHNSVPELGDAYTNPNRGPRPNAVPDNIERVEKTAADWTRALREFALAHEADQVGVAEIDPLWVYQGFEADLPHVALFVVAMDHRRSADLPPTAEHCDWPHEVAVQYNRGARVANNTALWIRSMGFEARPHSGPWVGSLNLIPAAVAAGLGELGKHGSMINRQLGSSFRLAAVETDMPLAADQPDRFGGDDFCLRCQVCTNACPPQAIYSEKQQVRGNDKWFVDFDKCIGYFNETYGCAICIAVCPWSTPGRAPGLAEKWTKRMTKSGNGL
jgi:NAD-dependent dihydropyrimidine dehydrogenase PreA subunit